MKRLVVAVIVTGVLALGSPASAHVSVNPRTGAANSTVDLSFQVPNERNVDTTKVEVAFSGAGVPTADTPSKAGWSSSVNIGNNGVTSIVWERGAIPPEKSETFVATIKVPAAGNEMMIKTLQTYADGQVVRWIDPPIAGGEPEYPATVFVITGGLAPTTTTSAAPVSTTVTTAPDGEKKKSDGGLSIGWVFIVVGVVLVVLLLLRAKIKNKQNQ